MGGKKGKGREEEKKWKRGGEEKKEGPDFNVELTLAENVAKVDGRTAIALHRVHTVRRDVYDGEGGKERRI